ncbi:MAG: hypothetical protein AABX99_01105 [Nanoarchaeota archaeon]
MIYDLISQYKQLKEKHSPEYIGLHLPDIFSFDELEERRYAVVKSIPQIEKKLEKAVFLYSKLLSLYNQVNQNGENPFDNPKGRMYNELEKIAEYTGIESSKIRSVAKEQENNLEVQKYRHEQFGYKADEVSEHDLVNIYLEKEMGATHEEIIRRYHLSSMYSAKKTYKKGKGAYKKRTSLISQK